MEGQRFDAVARALIANRPRRALLRTAAGALFGSLLVRVGLREAAACTPAGDGCLGDGECCSGARCRDGRCRCQSGLRNCAGPCCADCFIDWNTLTRQEVEGTEHCCAPEKLCRGRRAGPGDDRCCHDDEDCVRGRCCSTIGNYGEMPCGGRCCPTASCCGDRCCDRGLVCAQRPTTGDLVCVSANGRCLLDTDCHYGGETCVGGTCCAGDRVCSVEDPPGSGNRVPVCCPSGNYCDRSGGDEQCCRVGRACGTYRIVRIRH